jgi:hypothetical protein
MGTLTVNAQVFSVLAGVRESTDLRDETGKLLGVFVPAATLGNGSTPGAAKTTRQMFEHWKTLTQDPVALADLDRHIADLAARDHDDALHRSVD